MSAIVSVLLIVHIAVALVLGFGLWRALDRMRIYSALLAGLCGYQLLSISEIPALVEEFGIRNVGSAELVALVGALVVVVMFEVLAKLDVSSAQLRVGSIIADTAERSAVYLSVVLVGYVLIVLITALRGEALFTLNWEEARSDVGFLDSIATLALFMVFPACWILWKTQRRMLAGIALASAVMLTAVYGSRAALLTIPAIIGLDMLSRRLFTRNLRTLALMGCGVLGLVVLIHVTGRLIRGFGLGGLLALAQGQTLTADELRQLLAGIDWTGGESGIFEYYVFVISESHIPGVESLATLSRWLLMYLPRSLAEGFKPQDPTYALWTHAANSGLFDGVGFVAQVLSLLKAGDSGSIHPTFWGEAWMNGQWLALIAMCVVLAVFAHVLERLFVYLPSTAMALCGPAAVVGYLMVARGNSTIGFGYMAYLIPISIVASLLLSPIYRLFGVPPRLLPKKHHALQGTQ